MLLGPGGEDMEQNKSLDTGAQFSGHTAKKKGIFQAISVPPSSTTAKRGCCAWDGAGRSLRRLSASVLRAAGTRSFSAVLVPASQEKHSSPPCAQRVRFRLEKHA